MRTPEQVRWDFVQQWLDKAHKDQQAAAILFNSDIGDYDSVGFHTQQAAEKFLKALLVRYQVEFPKTHSIAVLRQLVAQVDQPLAERLAPADALTPYGVEFRYPGDFAPLSHGQGAQALQLAEQVRDLILTHLQPYLTAGRPTSAESDQGA
jgi:HEPN domain-containing protein